MDTTDASQNGMDFIQSMDVSMDVIQISADRLEGLRTTCSTSASLTQQEIRSLETKLIRMFSELLVKKAKLRDRIPSITASTVELRQWLRVVGLSQDSINNCLQRLNTMEQLLERSDIELKDLLANNNSKDEEIRRLTNAMNNLKKCRNAIENGKNEPDNLFWDSWDRHHHRNSSAGAVASPRAHRNKHIKTRHSPGIVIDHNLQSPSLTTDGNHHSNMNNIHGSVHTLTPSPSPPNSPAVVNMGSNSNCNSVAANKTNRKSGTPPPKKKHETLLQPSTPSHTTSNNNTSVKLLNHIGGDNLTSSQQQLEQLSDKGLKSKYNTNEIVQQENNTVLQKAKFNETDGDPFSPSHYYYQQQQIDENNSNYGDHNNLQVPRSPCTPNIPIPTDHRQMKHMIQHRFTKVFKMRSTCDLCRKQMYFGLKCKDCKYRCHKDCETNVPPSCGCPKEFIDVFMQTLLNNGSNTSPNLGNNRTELIDSGYFNSSGGRRNYHHHAKSQIHPDSSSPGSSCNSSSPSSPALFINHQQQQQQYNQHASGIHSAGGILNQIPTPSSSGIVHNKQISQFNFPDVTITNQSNTKLLHSGASSIYNSNTNQLNENKISTVSSINSNTSNTKININSLQSNSNGNYNIGKQIIGNNNQIRPPVSELSDTHKSNDSDKTVSLSGSTSASTDSDRTPGRLDSTEEGESGHWLRQNSLSLKEWDIPYDDLHLKEKIGKGRFGTVHRAQWHGDVAVKLLKEDYLDDERTLEAFKLEVANFKKTRHENLVLFMGACMNPPYLAIVTSLCKGNTLYTYIHQRKEKFTINRSTLVAQQISQGMGYLHARGIYHKDLRTKNIFLENGKVIITDFGLFSSTKLLYCKLGLGIPNGWLCYLAPELTRSLTPYKPTDEILPFSKASDIYSFGTVWYELLCGEFPFKTQPPESIIWQVGRGMKQTLANLQTSRDVKEILMTCWSFQASDRPDFSKLLTLLERLPKKRLARSPSHPVSLSRSAESVF